MKHPHLAELLARTDATTGAIEAAVTPLSAEALAWRPAPDRWCVADVLEHLSLVMSLYEPPLRTAIADRSASDAAYRPGWLQGKFIAIAGVGGRSVRAPKSFAPRVAAGAESQALARFLGHAGTLRELIVAADGRELNGRRFRSPITRLIRFTPGEALTLMVSHNERHAEQIERVIAAQ